MAIERAITYLEHDCRGKCGKYKIAYIGKHALHTDESKEANGYAPSGVKRMYPVGTKTDINKNHDDGLSTFQALEKC